MNAKHTPSPWYARGPQTHSVWICAKAQKGGPFEHVAFARVFLCQHGKRKIDPELRKNADLILAAPELLAALKDLEAQARKWAPNLDRSRSVEAIAKAEGVDHA